VESAAPTNPNFKTWLNSRSGVILKKKEQVCCMRMIKTTLAVLTLCAGLLVLTSAVTLVRHNPGVFNSGISRYTVGVVYAGVTSVGLLYAGVTQDFSGAAKWWSGSAERGNPFSQTMLGGYYALLGDSLGDRNYFFNSDGTEDTDKIEQSYAEGMKWLRLASEKGSENAQDLINIMYYDEDSASSKDRLEAAIRWGEAVEVKL
jgi:hypothetical protein